MSESDGDNELVALLRPLWSEAKVSTELKVELGELRAAAARGEVLGLSGRESEALAFPVAQFERASGDVRVRAGIKAMLLELRDVDPWAVGVLIFATPAPEFDGATPAAAAAGGATIDDLRAFAALVAAEQR